MEKNTSNISSNLHEISNNSSSFEQPRDADDVFEPAADENNGLCNFYYKCKKGKNKL
jgi:hypothetical protein